jgi:hypothetical protein
MWDKKFVRQGFPAPSRFSDWGAAGITPQWGVETTGMGGFGPGSTAMLWRR